MTVSAEFVIHGWNNCCNQIRRSCQWYVIFFDLIPTLHHSASHSTQITVSLDETVCSCPFHGCPGIKQKFWQCTVWRSLIHRRCSVWLLSTTLLFTIGDDPALPFPVLVSGIPDSAPELLHMSDSCKQRLVQEGLSPDDMAAYSQVWESIRGVKDVDRKVSKWKGSKDSEETQIWEHVKVAQVR